jgi:hypothetical protein
MSMGGEVEERGLEGERMGFWWESRMEASET